MVESKRENARDIIDKYLLKSLQVLKKRDHVETRLKVYYDIAKFADAEYTQVPILNVSCLMFLIAIKSYYYKNRMKL